MNRDLAALVDPIRAIAREASQRILDIYSGEFNVAEKADRSPVTDADLAAHNSIIKGLSTLTPQIPIISEESAEIDFAERRDWQWLWLVDPLDGTRQFVRQNDEFSVNIALIHDHRAVFGLILIPITGVCYFAFRGGGAFKQIPDQNPHPIHTRRINRHPIQVAGSRYYTGDSLRAFLNNLGHHDYLGVGSALKSCLVAEGKVDLYPRFGPTGEWDTAAAQIIVEEAGGGLTDVHMQPLRYNTRPTLLNPDFLVFGDPSHEWSQYLPRHKSSH